MIDDEKLKAIWGNAQSFSELSPLNQYRLLRLNRMDRLGRLKALKAPMIVIRNEQLLLLHARYLHFKPDRMAEYQEIYSRRNILEGLDTESAPN